MEFVQADEVRGLFRDHGIVAEPDGESCVYLRIHAADAVRVHLRTPESTAEPEPGATVIEMSREDLAGAIEAIIHRLHLVEVLLVPVGRWQDVFDAVAFGLADNEEWQQIDAAATVELKTRDPIFCTPADYHTLTHLLTAIFKDAESPQQGLMLTTTAAPMVALLIPDGAIRLVFGSQAMADEATEGLGVA